VQIGSKPENQDTKEKEKSAVYQQERSELLCFSAKGMCRVKRTMKDIQTKGSGGRERHYAGARSVMRKKGWLGKNAEARLLLAKPRHTRTGPAGVSIANPTVKGEGANNTQFIVDKPGPEIKKESRCNQVAASLEHRQRTAA